MSERAALTFDLVGLLRSGWKRVALLAAIGLALATTYALLAPKWYRAGIAVVPVPPPRGSMPMMGGGMAGVAAALDLPIDVGLGASDVERIAAVFRSVAVTDAVIAKFDLMKRYEAKFVEEARDALWVHCSAKVEKKPGLVYLSCEDKDPKVAKALVEFFGEHGNGVFRSISRTSASEERRFLAARVAEARRDMDESSRKLREFQEKNKIIDLPEQSKAVVGAMASLRADLLAKQIQLAYLGGFSSPDESSAGQLRRQVAVLQRKLQSLEESQQPTAADDEKPGTAGKKPARRGGKGDGTGLFPSALAVPKLRFELERLFRDQKINELLYFMLAQRYENARVSEARDTSTFQVMDPATLPTKKDRPKRFMIVLAGLGFGLGLGLAWVLGPTWWRTLPATAVRGRERGPVTAKSSTERDSRES